MSSAFEGFPQRRDETGRLWVFMFGRWTPIAEPDEGGDAVPARLPEGPTPGTGSAEANPTDGDEPPGAGQAFGWSTKSYRASNHGRSIVPPSGVGPGSRFS